MLEEKIEKRYYEYRKRGFILPTELKTCEKLYSRHSALSNGKSNFYVDDLMDNIRNLKVQLENN